MYAFERHDVVLAMEYGSSTCVGLLDSGGYVLVVYSVHTAKQYHTKRAAVLRVS